jgi:hypothetical protein
MPNAYLEKGINKFSSMTPAKKKAFYGHSKNHSYQANP